MAYHITWGTYGTRLPGTDRPHVDRQHNEYGGPLAPEHPAREVWSRQHMRFDPIYLSLEQRKEVESAIAGVAERYNWTIHANAAQSDHVHVVITAPRAGEPLSASANGGWKREAPSTSGNGITSKKPGSTCRINGILRRSARVRSDAR